jgi:hypothetical protein
MSTTMKPFRLTIGSLLLGLLVCRICYADDLPAAKQAIFLARVIAYDANLKMRAGGTVNIGILVKKGDAESEKMADAITKAFVPLEVATMLGLSVKISRVTFSGRDSLDKSVRDGGIDTLYICSGLDGSLADIKSVSRARKVLTMASKEDHLKLGLSLGVFSIDGKNTIFVNLEASREEGAAFGPELLRLATVVR